MFTFADFLAGWNAGICGIVIGHPADTIKVRQQLMGDTGLVDVIRRTYKHEGIRGFYKGMAFPIISAGVLNALFFGSYGNTLKVLEPQGIQAEEETKKPNVWNWNVFTAGCIAGLLLSVVNCPIEVLKIKLQSKTGLPSIWKMQYESKYSGVIGSVRGLYKDYGFKIFYKGYRCTIYRDVFSSGIYTAVYEALSATNNIEQKSVSSIIFAGGMAGMLSWISIIPLDVMKSRIQADNPDNPKYKSLMDCFIKSYQSDGLKVFFRGSCMTIIRAFPVNGATFLGLEKSLQFFESIYLGQQICNK
ncbi:solute carrier family 25 member 45-like isoform X1 [Schistocerca cancellata]|uniref:solute carrier family 25 member 45-like isoform X1 n=2 Tax=Schistocerca cancellata TaxID=274614 RepID=UPI00211993B0|nr:solute carrier family 25 member 45-like isoform X1 [Schistocerca cancellata]